MQLRFSEAESRRGYMSAVSLSLSLYRLSSHFRQFADFLGLMQHPRLCFLKFQMEDFPIFDFLSRVTVPFFAHFAWSSF